MTVFGVSSGECSLSILFELATAYAGLLKAGYSRGGVKMKRIQGLLLKCGRPRRGRISGRHSIILMDFCLVLSLIWTCSCLLAPAAVVSSAAVSAAALLAEIEGLAQDEGKSDVVTVTTETDVYEGPGKNYLLKGALNKGDQIKVLGMREDWIQCSSGQYEIGWVQRSNVSE